MKIVHTYVAVFAVTAALISVPLTAQAGLADSLRDIRSTISQINNTADEASSLGQEVTGMVGGGSTGSATTTGIAAGQILYPKINNVSVYQSANKSSNVLHKLSKSTEMVYSGSSNAGFHMVTTEHGEGWVEATMVQ